MLKVQVLFTVLLSKDNYSKMILKCALHKKQVGGLLGDLQTDVAHIRHLFGSRTMTRAPGNLFVSC